MIDPRLLGRQRLLGEHGELHKHRHNFAKRHSITGRISPVVQIEPLSMQSRHDALAAEMVRRGYNHASPYTMPDLSYLPPEHRNVRVDRDESIRELMLRCPESRERIIAANAA